MSIYAEINGTKKQMNEIRQRILVLRETDPAANAEEIKLLSRQLDDLDDEMRCQLADARREAREDEEYDRYDEGHRDYCEE